jgi:hypothetical protein
MTQIEVIPVPAEPLPAGWKWRPVVRNETADLLLSAVPEDARAEVQNSALAVMARSTPPSGRAAVETGLVVGYVQSGKTLSFTTVAAIARDNRFPLVIVIAGTSIPLFTQSSNRLRKDLRLEKRSDRAWILFENPPQSDADRRAMQDVIDDWRDSSTPESDKQTILITVMKHHQRMENLIQLLAQLDLRDAPVLIVDDEADQASLNTQSGQGQQSTTYQKIVALKAALPRHTYLQYTATPQAPLLINIIDSLSPNFVQVLNPGRTYVGGTEFFRNTPLRFVRLIPPAEVPSPNNPLVEPPATLLEALRLFFLGVAAGILGGGIGNRSMLVHPSRTTDFHGDYATWVEEIFDAWKEIIRLPEADLDRQQLIADFRDAYQSLAETDAELVPFEQLVGALPRVFRKTRILEVNATPRGGTPQVDWLACYAWILIGGQAMDRGFTVEGLTVTYMPRGVGVGNADTLQQRARFFGYKREYLGLCRVFLEQQAIRAFQGYVEHEEDMRRQLVQYQNSGRPLDDWKRAFVMSPGMRPTRANVLEFDYIRGGLSDDWYFPKVALATEDVYRHNRAVCHAFLQGRQFRPDEGHPDRTPTMRHEICEGIPLGDAISQLLVSLRVLGATDSQRYTGLLLQLRLAIEEERGIPEVCSVYRMSPGVRRQRGVHDNGEIRNPFQGEAPVNPPSMRGSVYPGDRMIRSNDKVSIQIYELDLTQGENDAVVARNVPLIAVWVPSRLSRRWLVQERQGEHTPE